MSIITIDGGAASGKSSIASLLAKKINYFAVNSGLIYRQITFFLIQDDLKINVNNKEFLKDKNSLNEFKKFLSSLNSEKLEKKLKEFKKNYFKEELVSDDILIKLFSTNNKELFSEKISYATSYFSTYFLFLREFVNEILISISKEKENVIFEGRDMGTVVFPNAKLKIFLKADPKIAARRRQLQINDESYEEILEKIKYRNKQDQERKTAPLIPAKDAIIFDTSKYNNAEDATKEIIKLIKDKMDL
ncbi:MAG: cytidylate kinase [Candidatus Hepatoplasma vulgare]|nr:MAG: cytidylate kinase [Candidatus Hepatoplasma sp.]